MYNTYVDDLIFSVPKNGTYSISDVIDVFDAVYGRVARTTIWKDEPNEVWYMVSINWKKNDECINTFKSSLYDCNAVMMVTHKVEGNHSYYYDVPIFSYKIWLVNTYNQQYNLMNDRVKFLEFENKQLQAIISQSNLVDLNGRS